MLGQLVNGRAEAAVEAGDRGLAYGDGLFETLAVVGGQPRLWDYHMDRLLEGARRLGLPEPPLTTLREEARYLVQGADRAVLKIVLTRGAGEGRGYRPPARPLPTRLLSLHDAPLHPPEHWDGVDVRLCRTRLAAQPALAGMKHLNRLEQVLARGEWRDPAIAEGLMLDDNGLIIQGTATNAFAVQGRTLITPPLSLCGVAGVMRRYVLEQAEALGLGVEHRGLYPEELGGVAEMFLTNSVIGLWPVRAVANRPLAVGPVTRRLQEAVAGEALAPAGGRG
ncbi:aminodeoxychorismate lyase [Halorhodospira neutriphila]|uniref:Aminodeoxychorismate lyase n=1 Tax=Halorhodospira neutriphila TaxID=168379 RepID=A0ABS1E5N6_9GAMM|nr:aminodeoxychorismate lyase [Halorhodospira neutriphila]